MPGWLAGLSTNLVMVEKTFKYAEIHANMEKECNDRLQQK